MPDFSTISAALDALRAGKFIIVVDDEHRENEGDLVIAAQHITPEKMAFMIRYTGGVVCLALSDEIADVLNLPPMVHHNTSKRGTPYTVSIEAKDVDTGISAHDRAKTILAAIDPVTAADDLARPGHVFPLRAQDGGVLVRAGHTEAAVDLCRLAGLRAGGVISELMHEDGTMMRLSSLGEFAAKHDLPIICIADLIAWRRQHETFVRLESQAELETDTGAWKIRIYEDTIHKREHVALIKGVIEPTKPVLTRVHSECLTGDVFGSHHCDCGIQLHTAMKTIESEGAGVLLYLRQEGRGIGLANKVRAYALQQQEGLDTAEANERLGFPADLREYGIGAQILKDIGVGKLRLLTNNPRKIVGLEGYGLRVIEHVPLEVTLVSDKQRGYMKTKREKFGHLLKHV
jgi:3,4-dihydroxy 2-butanone 4-phosphate synthase/GTP cyclohydrolase II